MLGMSRTLAKLGTKRTLVAAMTWSMVIAKATSVPLGASMRRGLSVTDAPMKQSRKSWLVWSLQNSSSVFLVLPTPASWRVTMLLTNWDVLEKHWSVAVH
ncbi:hypothetical protein V8C86DRAFT_2527427 [Haematococcus lacustris]